MGGGGFKETRHLCLGQMEGEWNVLTLPLGSNVFGY